MKKILLFLLLLISVNCFCQKVFYASKFCTGKINSDKDGWIWGEDQEAQVKLTVHGKLILVDDEAKSAYTCGKVYLDEDDGEYTQTAWWSIDEKKRECMVKMVVYDTGRVDVYVMYYNQGIAFWYGNLKQE